jgi:hypothetical protein
MAYFVLVQVLDSFDNPVVGIGQNDMVFLSGYILNRIGNADFDIAMVFLGLGAFAVNTIGEADFANHGRSGGGGGSGNGSNGGGVVLRRFIISRKVLRSHVSLGVLLAG